MSDFDTVTRHLADAHRVTGVANSVIKRSLDLAVAIAALLVVAPLLLFVAMLIRMDDGGPVLFRQRRTGLNGRTFTIYKLRTMRPARHDDQVRQASRGDERITRIGAFLRALSIDELPQLLNVLRGDMSIVGPRPHAISHDERWEGVVPTYADRFRARPGLTGYAQVCGFRGEIHHVDDIRARVEADNFYIDNWSLKLEIKILLRTVPLLFHDPRAY